MPQTIKEALHLRHTRASGFFHGFFITSRELFLTFAMAARLSPKRREFSLNGNQVQPTRLAPGGACTVSLNKLPDNTAYGVKSGKKRASWKVLKQLLNPQNNQPRCPIAA
jgi:hypothetical protein